MCSDDGNVAFLWVRIVARSVLLDDHEELIIVPVERGAGVLAEVRAGYDVLGDDEVRGGHDEVIARVTEVSSCCGVERW